MWPMCTTSRLRLIAVPSVLIHATADLWGYVWLVQMRKTNRETHRGPKRACLQRQNG
ncbi:hypothetical protein CONPUDRAFT_85745 [Coniophora puteana RWD-64-598 SS2]|uniref:Uncharacterized protein n=1 Tax=Coniophora puteana (strain RWD-64-598) TaxID=741705 RepID=R7SEF9_CONPW|nr:uncharacterized protein CONPUDRAFT_85745 [Coniophora puteana RWD-64-598 SS2]EIW74571.1 hypothetical protein CONPUDRAFT_85745 [Coniophora puteana RWD-64-598 SS2]